MMIIASKILLRTEVVYFSYCPGINNKVDDSPTDGFMGINNENFVTVFSPALFSVETII